MRQRYGTVVAICYFDPATPYSVRLDPAGLPVGEDGAAITLKRADPAEIEKFWRFQSLLSIDQRTAFPLVADAVRLADASPALKERFEAVFKHAETMLDDAIHVMEDEEFKPLVMKMAAKLFGMPADEAAHEDLYPMLNVIWGHLMKMRESMPYLKEQSPHVIGFFQDAHPAQAGRWRQTDLGRQISETHAAVVLKLCNDLDVHGIEGHVWHITPVLIKLLIE